MITVGIFEIVKVKSVFLTKINSFIFRFLVKAAPMVSFIGSFEVIEFLKVRKI